MASNPLNIWGNAYQGRSILLQGTRNLQWDARVIHRRNAATIIMHTAVLGAYYGDDIELLFEFGHIIQGHFTVDGAVT